MCVCGSVCVCVYIFCCYCFVSQFYIIAIRCYGRWCWFLRLICSLPKQYRENGTKYDYPAITWCWLFLLFCVLMFFFALYVLNVLYYFSLHIVNAIRSNDKTVCCCWWCFLFCFFLCWCCYSVIATVAVVVFFSTSVYGNKKNYDRTYKRLTSFFIHDDMRAAWNHGY